MSDILNRIVATKREEIALALKKTPLAVMREDAESRLLTRDFEGALRAKIAAGLPAVIAEVKKASPVQGRDPRRLHPGRHRAELCRVRRRLPVGADRRAVFPGQLRLPQAGAGRLASLPVLRKDFMVDPYQVYEARAMGADCILLIAACLDDAQMADLEAVAHGLGMAVLVEVHDRAELHRALKLKTPLVGINNRDLRTFEVTPRHHAGLLADVPADRLLVTESGILSARRCAAACARPTSTPSWSARPSCAPTNLARRWPTLFGLPT